jgi:hypothetical protein
VWIENWNNVQNDDDDAHISWSDAEMARLTFQWLGHSGQDDITTARASKQRCHTYNIV